MNLTIFLKNIKEIDKIRLEGELQDIEFIKKDKTKIFVQAKSVYNYDDYNNVLANLKSAMRSLNEAQEKDINCKEVIYITNTPNPFKQNTDFFSGVTYANYDDLPSACKEIIDSIKLEHSLDFLNKEQFSIQVLPFHGESLDNRYKHIKELVNEFLATLQLSDSGLATPLLNIWQHEIFKNGTIPNTEVHIKKSEIIWPLIFLISDQASDDWLSDELDEGLFEEVKTRYRNLINNATDRFEMYTRVISDFNNYQFVGTNREKVRSFLDKMWRNYILDIRDVYLSTEEQEYLIKIILHKILVKKEYIGKIKMGAGL